MTDNEARKRESGDALHTEPVRSDAELLAGYVRTGEEKAFAEIVQRHSALVWRVCRGLLREPHDAEDAFQATFLVLVRQASRIKRPEQLSSWLYGVAYRIAMRLRAQGARRHRQEGQDISMIALAAPTAREGDVEPVVFEEVHRLPEKYRGAVVLCYFEGKTTEETAQALGCPVGTIKGWLSRAREILKKRIARRGIVFPAAMFAVETARGLASEPAPATLIDNTVFSCVQWHDNPASKGLVADRVVELANAAIRDLGSARRAITVAVVAGVAAVLVGLGTLASVLLYRGNPLPPKDHVLLQGSWQGTHQLRDGQKLIIAEMEGNGRWTFKGDDLIFDMGAQKVTCKFEIDPSQRPKAMTMVFSDNKGRTRRSQWIYELDGQTLKLAMSEVPNMRPRDFDAPAGSKSLVMIFQRAAQVK